MPDTGRLWIAQFAHRVDASARKAVRRAGFEVRAYLPDDAYVVRGPWLQVTALRKAFGVRCVVPYHPAYRIDPSTVPERLTLRLGDEQYRGPVDERRGVRNVTVLLFDRDRASKTAVVRRVRELGGQVVPSSPEGLYVAATLPVAAVARIAAMDEVCAIERRFTEPRQTARWSRSDAEVLTLNDVRTAGGLDAASFGWKGRGVSIGVIDDGIRVDQQEFLDRPIRFVGPHFAGRSANHGTPVSGILAGKGGIAPLATILFAHGDRTGKQHRRYELMRQFVTARASLVSESAQFWPGEPFISYYEGGAQMLDDLVCLHDLLVCQSIGNCAPGHGTGGSWAKNALIVGGVDPRGQLDDRAHRPTWTRGPIPERRIKPDLVHFGNDVLAPSASANGAYEPFGGTSCSAPIVAGQAALAIEMWANNAFGACSSGGDIFSRRPHASTVKALLIHSAFSYPIGATFTRDDQGWGRPHLGNLDQNRDRLFVANEDVVLHDHEAQTYEFRIRKGEPQFRATLVYTDPPAATSAARALVNDLDLTVIDPDGTTYLGNHGLREGNVSQTGGTPDRLNNVENVLLSLPREGIWRVIVSAHRVAMPNRDGGQRYALVVGGVGMEGRRRTGTTRWSSRVTPAN